MKQVEIKIEIKTETDEKNSCQKQDLPEKMWITVDYQKKFLVRVRTATLSELACSFINNINDKL